MSDSLRLVIEAIVHEEGGLYESLFALLQMTFKEAMRLGSVEESDDRLLQLIEDEEEHNWAVDGFDYNGDPKAIHIVNAIPYLFENEYFPPDYDVVRAASGEKYHHFLERPRKYEVVRMPSHRFLRVYTNMIMRYFDAGSSPDEYVTTDYPIVDEVISAFNVIISYMVDKRVIVKFTEDANFTVPDDGVDFTHRNIKVETIPPLEDVIKSLNPHFEKRYRIDDIDTLNLFRGFLTSLYKEMTTVYAKHNRQLDAFFGFKIQSIRRNDILAVTTPLNVTTGVFTAMPHSQFVSRYVHRKYSWE